MRLSIKDNNAAKLKIGAELVNIGAEKYTGSYEWTPNRETQTIPINGLQAMSDITINPIPSNYGLVTYDGSVITVS